MAGLSKIDLQDVSNALTELSAVIESITTGKSDGPQDEDVWDLRTKGGLQVVRLRAMLSPAELDLTAVNSDKLATLRNIWSLIQLLGYGQHLDGRDECNSDKYRGPLFLPNEIGPKGRIHNFDEVVDTWPGGVPDFVSDEIRSRFMETKQESWSWIADELRDYAELLVAHPEAICNEVEGESPNDESACADDGNGVWPEVDLKLSQVRFRDECHDLTDSQAIGLNALVEAKGEWVSWSGLGISKPSKVKKALPEELKKLIKTSPGKGYRIILSQ